MGICYNALIWYQYVFLCKESKYNTKYSVKNSPSSLLMIFYVKTWFLPLFFFFMWQHFFFFFLSCSKHFKDHITMKIELCTLSEFFEFDLEKKNQILKKKKKKFKNLFQS